jgi:maltose O-acetyltransferase
MDEIIYELSKLSRPGNSKNTRLLLKLNSLPIIRNIKYIKLQLLRSFKFPQSTTLNVGFYCSSPLIHIGENVGLADTFILAYAKVTIGNNCSFSYNNMLITSTHDINNFSTVIAKPIVIGNNCWITTNCTILPGVTIGDNTIIGAGSVVTSDIPSNVFAAGNPCKVIRHITFKK